MRDLFTISSSALPDATRVAGFRGTEGISRPYEFDVYLLLGPEGQDLDLADAVGAKAKLTIDRGDGRPPFVFHGIFAAFELLRELGERSVFHATLVPQLWQLTQTFHSRIFTNKTIPDILQEVLEDGGLGSGDYVLRLGQDYKLHEHVCQYAESHFDFISRWMEREGMYYYFEQGDAAERLVITDSKSFQDALEPEPVRFFALGGYDVTSGEALHTFTCKHHALPAGVKVRDYDYGKPTLDVSGSAAVSKVGIGEISVHGRRFFTPDDGKRLARLRAEELLARQIVYRGTGTALYLRAGYFFTLEDHPRPAFDARYLVTEAEHEGNQALGDAEMRALTGIETDRVYWVDVKAIPATVQFRAESKAAWPRVDSFENGVVCGPTESEYAQIDEHGRYHVKFKFDESDLGDGKASTWVRMLQPHGGNPEGWHFPLRKGTEVLFTFLGGDPDRPVIAGVVPNAHNPSPVTRTNHTTNVIQTGGLNRLEMEDRQGSQWSELSTPPQATYLFLGATGHRDHNFVINTQGTGLVHTGSNHDVFVDGKLHERVRLQVHQEFDDTKTTAITGAVTEEYKDTVTQTYAKHHQMKVEAGGRKEEVVGGYTQKIEGGVGYDQSLSPRWHTHVEGPWNMEADSVKWKITEKVDVQCEEWTVLQTGSVSWQNVGDISWKKLANENSLTVGQTSEVMVGLKEEVMIGGSVEVTLGAAAELFVGAKADIMVAAQYECNVGPKAEAKTAKVKAAEAEVEKTDALLKSCLLSLQELQIALFKHDLLVFSSGFTIWQ